MLLDGKTGPRWVPMTACLRAALDGWHAEQDRPDRGTVWRGTARPGSALNQALEWACPRAEVPVFTCYGCRRRVSSTLIDRIDGERFGVHTYESWMGHSYEIGRRTYAEVCGERLDVLDEAQGGGQPGARAPASPGVLNLYTSPVHCSILSLSSHFYLSCRYTPRACRTH